jgi:hypothetical protein
MEDRGETVLVDKLAASRAYEALSDEKRAFLAAARADHKEVIARALDHGSPLPAGDATASPRPGRGLVRMEAEVDRALAGLSDAASMARLFAMYDKMPADDVPAFVAALIRRVAR